MACLSISLPSWLSWLKHFVPIPSSVRSYANSARDTSSPQGSSLRESCRSSFNWRVGYESGIVELPCPEPAHMPKSVIIKDRNWQPFSYNQIRPVQHEPPAIYPSMLEIKRFLEYKGVGHNQDSPICLWLSVRYHNSRIGLVGVLRLSFNTDVLLREKLKKVIPKDNWKYLEEKHGFGFNVL